MRRDRIGNGPEALGLQGQALVFGAALLVRLAHVWAMTRSPYFDHPIIDAKTYVDAARLIAAGRGHPDAVFWQPPGYPYFLGLLAAVLGPSLLAPRLVQAILGAVTAALTARLGARAFGRRVGLAAGLGAAFYPLLFYFDAELLPPTLTVVLLLAGLELAQGAGAAKPWRWAAAGLALGLASTATATALVVVAVAAAFARRAAPAVLLGAAVAIAPVTAHNLVRGGEPVLISSNLGVNLFVGNNPDYERTVAIRPDREWDRLLREPLAAGATSARARSDFFVRRVAAWMASDPAAFARLQLHKARLFLGGDERLRNHAIYPFRGDSPLLAALLWKVPGLAFPWGVLAPLGLVGLAARGRRAPLLACAGLAYAVAVIAFFVTARYRVPLVPLLLVFAAEGVRWWVRDAAGPARLTAGAGCVALGLVSNLGQGAMERTMNPDAEYSLAVQLAGEGRDAEADSLYRSALRQRPDYEEAWLNLGDLDRRAGRLEDAEREFARARALDPGDARAVVDLAVVRAQRGDIAAALPLFRRALEMRPGDPLALDNLRSVVAVKSAERARAAGPRGRLPPPDDALMDAWQLLYDHTGDPRWLAEIERGRAERAVPPSGRRGR